MKQEPTFWADEVAREIAAAGKTALAATGITPSGEIHIGNMREVVTADVVVRALRELGHQPQFKYIADTFDPLRRVYPFLDAAKYQPHVGRPLSEIPCPCEKHESYAEHYLEPFLRSLEALDIQVEVLRADRMYKEGLYAENILRALKERDKIRAILKEETGKETEPGWTPFHAICEGCKKMTTTQVVVEKVSEAGIGYRCDCGHEGIASLRGGGKLSWRVDWPARWQILKVTIEPFGKDHASKGGSYDTGVRIAREVFQCEPPFPVVYEWISLRGGGDMSSSKGNVISVADMLEVVPPDVLKYSVLKVRPNRRIVFDPALPMLSLIDEYDDLSNPQRHHRAAELSAVKGRSPVGAPFRHMVSLVQAVRDRVDIISKVLKNNGYPVADPTAVAERAQYARRWLERFAPEEYRFFVTETLPEAVKELSEPQRKALALLAERYRDGLRSDEIQALIYAVKDEVGLPPAALFEAIYKALLGKDRGPRAGFFLSGLEASFVQKRLREAAESSATG